MSVVDRPAAPLAKLQRWSLLTGGVAAVLSLIGALFWTGPFLEAYLIGFLFCLGVALGSLALSMIHHLTGGGWGLAIRPVLEAGLRTLPWLAVLSLPILLLPQYLYVWSRPEAVSHDPLLQFKAPYLNVASFRLRAGLYFVIWVALAALLDRWSRNAISTRKRVWPRRQQALSGPGLVLYGLTMTFAAVDWVMSLEPYWFSSAFGVLFMASQAVAALAFAIVITIWLQRYAPWTELAGVERRHDLGNLLLAFVMVWSYIAFMQFLIVWSGNLPEETPWYLHRAYGPWLAAALLVVGFHFAVPFLLLLSRETKRNSSRLACVAGLLLVMRFVDLTWLIVPTFTPDVLRLHWLHIVTPIALFGLWLALFARSLSQRVAWMELHREQGGVHE